MIEAIKTKLDKQSNPGKKCDHLCINNPDDRGVRVLIMMNSWIQKAGIVPRFRHNCHLTIFSPKQCLGRCCSQLC